MRILSRYTISSILKVATVTIMLFALILAAVELFSKMDQIMNGDIPPLRIAEYIVLSLPQYLLMVASIAFLFSVTYYLSTLSANNELIPILNAGVSPWRLKAPIVVLAIVLTVLGSVYQEKAVIAINAVHDELEVELFGSSSTRDTRNIVLSDPDGYLIYTQRFSEASQAIYDPVLVQHADGAIIARIEADRAHFEEGRGWVFENARVYHVTDGSVASRYEAEYTDPSFDIEPRLFRSQNTSIETMDRETAVDYLASLYANDRVTWHEKATDYYRRIFSPLAIFTLMFISVSMNFSFRRNVLLFSVIQSLSIAVIYYVADMVFSIMGHQGAVAPVMTVVLPIVLTILLSLVLSILGRKL